VQNQTQPEVVRGGSPSERGTGEGNFETKDEGKEVNARVGSRC